MELVVADVEDVLEVIDVEELVDDGMLEVVEDDEDEVAFEVSVGQFPK